MNRCNYVPFQNTDISSGFWKDRQDINRTVTVYSIYNRFSDTGRFEAFKFIPLSEGGVRPHFFWDSDVAKWIESCAYILEKNPDPVLEEIIDNTVDLIEKNQCEDGYFNIYFTVVEPENRFRKRDYHELYCAGHLIEAAVAYYKATGKDKLLNIMKKYIGCIEDAFVIRKTADFTTPGHEEIELALYKLFKLTDDERYLNLAKHFIDKRGTVEEEKQMYNQSHLPVREQFTAEGHSVRACYLYSAMADIAYETKDEEMYNACKKLFNNIYKRRSYITGGIGSSRHGEAFTVDYDLPNSTAYAETCAAISLAFFASRMQRFEPKQEYADIIEKIMYNGMLSGISLDGKAFFYENPLEILHSEQMRNKSVKEVERFAPTRRKEVFDCSCCPPNITRFIASVADYIYTYNNNEMYIHQYISGNTEFSMFGRDVSVNVFTDYPYDGNIKINIGNMAGLSCCVRIPMWCDSYKINVTGGTPAGKDENGYVRINCTDSSVCVDLNLDIVPELVYASPKVAADAASACLCVGPLVYCAEQIDNAYSLRSIVICRPLEYKYVFSDELNCRCIELSAVTDVVSDDDSLYTRHIERKKIQAKFIPYFAFANREDSDMLVWFRYI